MDENSEIIPKFSDPSKYTEQQITRSHYINGTTIREVKSCEAKSHAYQQGIIFTSNFTLFYKSRKHRIKDCVIPIKEDSEELTIFEKQAIDEAYYANLMNYRYYKSLHDNNPNMRKEPPIPWLPGKPALDSKNLVFVNLGFVISDGTYQKNNMLKRRFISVPIHIDAEMGLNISKREKTNGHSEINFYDLILNASDLIKILQQFILKANLIPGVPRKVYACAIDIFTSQDMCDECEDATYQLQQQLPILIGRVADTVKFVMPKNLKVIVRVCSSRSASSSAFRKLERNGNALVRCYSQNDPMYVKESSPYFILHSDPAYRDKMGMWYDKTNIVKFKQAKKIARSVFINDKGNQITGLNSDLPSEYNFQTPEEIDRSILERVELKI